MSAVSNVNLDSAQNNGNVGPIKTTMSLGIVKGMILVPKGTTIPSTSFTSQSAFLTYLLTKTQADTRSSRWYTFGQLDKFNWETKATASEDTGRLNLAIYDFAPKFSVRYMQTIWNFVEAKQFQNCQSFYDVFLVDDNGYVWGTTDTSGAGGLQAFKLQQFYVNNMIPKTVSNDTQYMITVTLDDPHELNENLKVYEANLNPDNIAGLQNAKMYDITSVTGSALSITTTTTKVFAVKYGQDSRDLVADYGSSLTAACFRAYNQTTAAAAQ